MTQDEKWKAKYDEVVSFIEASHRNPSKHRIEKHGMLNWVKQQHLSGDRSLTDIIAGHTLHVLFWPNRPMGDTPKPRRVHPAPYPNHLSPPYLKEDLKPLPQPLAILARGLQPLLLVALSLRYARTIIGPACLVLLLREGAISNTMLKHLGVCRAAGG